MNYDKNTLLSNLLPNSWLPYIDLSIVNSTNNMLQEEILQCQKNIYEIYPFNQNDIFKILHLTSLEKIKVVIIGQDPYHANKFQANGIAFSVNNNVTIPPSLRNIFKELSSNYNNSLE